MEADRKRTEETIDLIGQMTRVIVKNDEYAPPSEKKTVVTFLSSYIRSGYSIFV